MFFLTKNELKLTSPDGKRLIRVLSEVIEGIFGKEFLVVLHTTKKPSQIWWKFEILPSNIGGNKDICLPLWWQNFLPFALGVLSSSDEFWSTWNLTFSFFTTIASKCPFEMLSRSSIISDNFSLRFLLAPRSSSTFSKNRCFSWLRFFWDRARYFAKSSADSSLTFLSLKSEMEKKIYRSTFHKNRFSMGR